MRLLRASALEVVLLEGVELSPEVEGGGADPGGGGGGGGLQRVSMKTTDKLKA